MFKLKTLVVTGLVALVATIAIGVSTASADTTLPMPWQTSDIGSVGVAGSASYQGNTFTVKGSGVDIWSNADSFRYVYQPLNGDGEITARVASQQNTDGWALAGVMIRETLNANSREAIAAVTPSNGASFTWRAKTGNSSSYADGNTASAPYWVRLNRTGNFFTAYKSTNGTTWTQYAKKSISMGSSAYVGLAVTSHNNSTLATDTFDNVSVATADTIAPTVSVSAPADEATVSGSTTVTANATDNVGVQSVQFKLDGTTLGSADTTSPYTVTWDTTTATNGSHALTAVATDTSGNVTASSTVNVTVNNVTAPVSTTSIWADSDTPAVLSENDSASVELGVKFRSSVATTVEGVKFYKGIGNGGTHTGSLWQADGTKLASVTFTGETASGWQTAYFASPINIAANTTYIISYFAPNGHYASSSSYFTSAYTNGVLTALQSGTDGGNGVYRYGVNSVFPDATYQTCNYWVDVIVGDDTGSTGDDTTAPVISNVAANSTTTTAQVSWATDEVSSSRVEYGLTTSYGSQTTLNQSLVSSHSVAMTGLNPATTYHYRVLSSDAAGNLATSSDKTFTTADSSTPTNPLSNLSKMPWYGGSDYWAQYPDAVKAGWSQPNFFPVGDFWDFWPGGDGADAHAAVQWDKDHGINFYVEGNGDQDACVLRDVGGMSWIGAPGSIQNLDTCGENLWPGNGLEDEIDGTSSSNSAAFAKLEQQSATARQQTPNKFVDVNYTSIPIQIWTADTDGEQYFNANYADMISVDEYLSSTPNRCNTGNPNWWPFIGTQPLSVSTCRQGESYGRLVQSMMMRQANAPQKPLSAFIDIYGGADPAATTQSADQVKAAVVSNIIHGAGFIIYFPLSFYPSCNTNRLMDASVPACAAANTAAAGDVNNQVKSWAPILNTQSYQYTFGSNLDTMLKWYDGSAYILAMTDGGTGSRTFTLPSGLAGVPSVTETISGRTIPVSNGSFTDSFAVSSDYRLYKVTP